MADPRDNYVWFMGREGIPVSRTMTRAWCHIAADLAGLPLDTWMGWSGDGRGINLVGFKGEKMKSVSWEEIDAEVRRREIASVSRHMDAVEAVGRLAPLGEGV